MRNAFAHLIRGNRYENLEVADLIARAGVSRSTFYAHYRGMDALLADSIKGPFAVLADTVLPVYLQSSLVDLLEHFWENRRLARGIFAGPVRGKTTQVLVLLIEDRLRVAGLRRRGMILPPRLVAIQLAEIMLAPITAWLLGESRCSADTLATGLRRVSTAALASITA